MLIPKITILNIFMYRSSAILLLLLIATSTYQQCTQTSQNDLLQSGNTFFFNANGGVSVREHLYEFPITYNVPAGSLQITASASSFQVYSNSGVNFQIISSVGRTTAFGVVGLLLGQDSSWNNVRVFYLVSSRNDFFLGTFSAGNSCYSLGIYLLQKFAPGNSISIDYAIPGWTNSQQSFTAIAQISGLRTTANSYTTALGSINFDSRSGELIIQVNLNSSPSIESISISYIIFKNSAPFAYSSFDSMIVSSATYQFIGISQLSSSSASYRGSGFVSQAATQGQLSCIGSNCPSECVTSQYCIAYRGQISGANCLLCGQGQVAVNGGCQSIVPVQCGTNQFYNGSDCVCFQGYIFVNSACYQACGTNAYIFNQQCQCLPGHSLSLITYTCVKQNTPVCGQNFVLINNVCTCKPGFGMINSLCLACPANSYVAPNGNCVCSPGLVLNSSTLSCVSACYPNSYANSQGQCICNSGYYNTGTACILQPNCVNGQIWSNNACICPQGMIVDSITNQCTYCNTADRQVSNNSCVCSPSHFPTSIGCSACPSNSVYNTTSASCTCIPGYNMQSGTCILATNCPLNSYWNQTTMRCDCTYFGDYVINGFCQQCPLNSRWNGTACACFAGLISNGIQCVCPFGQFWNGTACVCGPNKFLVGNVCAFCDNNAVYNAAQKKCICKDGWYSVFDRCSRCDSSCGTCSGPSSSNCLTCPTGSRLNNGVCGCNPNGQYLDANKVCQNCMNRCISCTSATSCTACSTGYSPSLEISGSTVVVSCQIIPTGTSSILTQRGQVTGNGFVYQGVGLSLMPIAILADGCKICDNLLKVQALSSFATITATTEYVANSQYWFVVSFSFGSASFIPTFQFTIQIDPQYASYFSSADMAQKIIGSYSQTQSSTSTTSQAVANPNFSTGGPNSPPPKFTSNLNSNTAPIARSQTVFGSTSPNASAKSDQTVKPSVTKDLKIVASLFA